MSKIIHFLYVNILKKILFKFAPEDVHDRFVLTGKLLGGFWLTKKLTGLVFNYKDESLRQNIVGIDFKNPIGLSAGFDKNAELTNIMPYVGFGFEEVGSVTALPCEGNARPRLWRLKKSKSLLVYYGLKNDGADVIYNRLVNKKFEFPVGISIAKTNCADNADTANAVLDYIQSYRKFKDIGHYVTLNISCPNAFGGLYFTTPDNLDLLLKAVQTEGKTKPIFLKMSPDLSNSVLDELIGVINKYENLVDGVIISNLTKNRVNSKIMDTDIPENGGISGKVVEELANEMISSFYKKTKGKYVIIGCGGVFNGADAYEKIKRGASLIHMITGMIFEGPQVVGEINRKLVELLKKDGYKNIHEAIGAYHR